MKIRKTYIVEDNNNIFAIKIMANTSKPYMTH